MQKRRNILLLLLIPLTLVACRVDYPQTTPTTAAVATVPLLPEPTVAPPVTAEPTEEPPPADTPTAAPEPTTTTAPEPMPTATAGPVAVELPAGVFYDLGEATIVQANFPEDSRFRNMPVQLNGVLGVPETGEGPFPVVLILHGTHPGCPVNEMGVDAWPCEPEVEQRNYAGFEYLVRELAARGYVALSININAQNTFGFGEPVGGERVEQIVDLHLSALAEAANGGENGFGVALEGVPDMRRLTLMGHSRGGEAANWLAGDFADGPHLASPLTYADRGYGPVNGMLLIAPAIAVMGTEGTEVPLAVIISGCDGDVIGGDGQYFYEAVRLGDMPNTPATSVVLWEANHNAFNTILGPDAFGTPDRPHCDGLLDPQAQRQFLVDYAAEFLTYVYDYDPSARLESAARLGMDAVAPTTAELLGLPAVVTSLAAGEDRLPLFVPSDAAELATNRLGGAVAADGLATHFCEAGYSVPETNPGSEPCLRPNVTIPAYPYMLVAGWEAPGAALRFELPEGARDLSRYTTISLRAATDPLSPLNAPGETPRFSVRLTDGAGNTAAVATREDEPALNVPSGNITENEFFGQVFTGLVPMPTIRVPLAGFEGVDLGDVAEIALVFDQADSGNLFIGDLELVRLPHVIGAYSSLLQNAAGENGDLTGVARFNGVSSCTGVFIAPTGSPDAPAYLLTNGHCAQEWEANQVSIDQPAPEDWSATFNYFIDTAEQSVTVPAVRVAYSTMKGRDIALVELGATAGELSAQGITPVEIAAEVPDGPFGVRVVGVPVTRVPAEIAFLREEHCRAAGRADLLEFIWHFNDTIPTACQDIYGGSSGSPVFIGDGPEIIGLINTTNIGGLTPCGLGTPCEIRPEGATMVPSTSYAIPTGGVMGCFDAAGVFDLSAPDCPLDDGRQLLISGYATQGTRNPTTTPDGSPVIATWNATLAGDRPFYRYKIGRAGEVDCRADEGYGAPVALSAAPLIDDPLPPDEGHYLLCVLAGESETVDETWQPVERPTVARVEVDNTPPALEPQLSFMSEPFGGLRFEPIFAPPELSDFRVKFGPAAEIDCADPEGFQIYRRFPFAIPAEQLPARICVIGFDTPGNAGEVHEVVVGN